MRRFLFLVFLSSSLLSFSQGKAVDLKPKKYKELLATTEDAILVDIRTPREWAKGMMPNAIGVNYFKNFEDSIQKIDKTKPVFIYCATGHRSPGAMKKMIKAGFVEVYNLDGGVRKWKKAGFDLN